ncbi:MAG TPA: hypothetical protein VFO85_08540, partial [Vicinamibacteria bacterium]|nr:hypothetical protein [Vicinamibacteria bacterium]
MQRAPAVLFLTVVLALSAASAPADVVVSGQAGQAYYRIVKPDAWNGGLVIWNHGFTLSPPGPVTDMGPLATLQLAQGYAVAASSYRLRGWAVFKTSDDLETLYERFVENFGTPAEV